MVGKYHIYVRSQEEIEMRMVTCLGDGSVQSPSVGSRPLGTVERLLAATARSAPAQKTVAAAAAKPVMDPRIPVVRSKNGDFYYGFPEFLHRDSQ